MRGGTLKRSSNVLSSASRVSREEWNACARGDRVVCASVGPVIAARRGMTAAGTQTCLRGVRPVYSCLHFDLDRRLQWMRDSVAAKKYIRVLQELPARRQHGKAGRAAWVTGVRARASMTTGRGAAHVRIMWPRVWSSLSMTNMAALGTLVSLITTTFSRLPSSGIRQESKSSGLFMALAAAPLRTPAARAGLGGGTCADVLGLAHLSYFFLC